MANSEVASWLKKNKRSDSVSECLVLSEPPERDSRTAFPIRFLGFASSRQLNPMDSLTNGSE